MIAPKAAPNRWPYWDHGTLAQVREDQARAAILDDLGRGPKIARRA